MIEDPAVLGALLALIYTIASFAQIVVGRLIDRMPFKPLQLWMSVAQVPLLIFAAHTQDVVAVLRAAGGDDFRLRLDPVHRRHDRALRR